MKNISEEHYKLKIEYRSLRKENEMLKERELTKTRDHK